MVKNPPSMWKTCVQSLLWEDPLEGIGHGNPLQHSCLENCHGQRCLAGYSPWGRKESDRTERLITAQHEWYLAVFVLHNLITSDCLLFSCQVGSDSLNPMDCSTPGFPRLSPSPAVSLNSCLLSRWCHPAMSSSVAPFSSCTQSCPASRSSSVSQFFTSGGQRIGASASASVLPVNIQGWFSLGWTGWILQSKGLSRVFSGTTVQKRQFFGTQPSLWFHSHIRTWLWRNRGCDCMNLCWQSDVSPSQYAVSVCHSTSSKEQVS